MNAPLRVARRGLTIGARGTYNRHEHLKIMEAAALDLHLLVRLDSKSAPRARSFRERTEVRLLCVSDACALDARCALVPDHEHASANVDEGIRQEHVGTRAT